MIYAKPKSSKYTLPNCVFCRPTAKFDGLMSRWTKPRSCTSFIACSICLANLTVVDNEKTLRDKFRRKTQRLLPCKSITIIANDLKQY
uniref:Uncharacterized protein n=1 Tax=Romanomermis culicivorax TaxID=13658 RepID=A0A915K684_ROMCU